MDINVINVSADVFNSVIIIVYLVLVFFCCHLIRQQHVLALTPF